MYRNCLCQALVLTVVGLSFAVGTSDSDRAASAQEPVAQETPIDFERARALLEKRRRGEALTATENEYLERAREARRRGASPGAAGSARIEPRESTGLTPLSEMTSVDRYRGEEGGLYGDGRNAPPLPHLEAAKAALARVQPLNAAGEPAADGRIVFISISMSNATQEFSRFKRLADADSDKSPLVTIVDCAQGGQAMAEWATADAPPWREADRRLASAGVSPQQVQIAWIKLANKSPRGDLEQHGRKLQEDTQAVIQLAKRRFPNLQVAYLSSRIYGGYARGNLNPEPYAYESAFVVRWLIQDQIAGDAQLNYDAGRAAVQAPVLLWGPYLWADGMKQRKSDQLFYAREDLAADGTHPSESGRDKVARLLLEFCEQDELARTWFRR